MKTSKIGVKVGIYDAEYVIRDYGHKIIVTVPYVHWHNNSGCLDSYKVQVTDPREMEAVRKFVEAGCLLLLASNNGGCLSFQDVLDGNLLPGVEILADDEEL
jgi:hypothetical protein